MKYSKIALAILAALFASIALADDFKTTNGKEYKNATISRVEPDGIVIRFFWRNRKTAIPGAAGRDAEQVRL